MPYYPVQYETDVNGKEVTVSAIVYVSPDDPDNRYIDTLQLFSSNGGMVKVDAKSFDSIEAEVLSRA